MANDEKSQKAQEIPEVDAALDSGGTHTDDPTVAKIAWQQLRQRWTNTLTQVRAEFRVAEHLADEQTKKAAREVAAKALKAIAFIDEEMSRL